MFSGFPGVKVEILRSRVVLMVPVVVRLSVISERSRFDVTEPALVRICPARLMSVPPPSVETLPVPEMESVPCDPVVTPIEEPVDARAPVTDILPFPAVLSVLVRLMVPGELRFPTL